jgi:scyllo-inositol 2-dehydrogenase (NADP+)
MAPAKKKVLAVVGGGYHDFDTCGAILKGFLQASGRYQVSLTEDRSVFASGRMASFDACVVYTQGGTLTDNQLNGLLEFVKSGKGFVGIHCASDSFTDRPEYIEMVGGRFISHGPVMEFGVRPRASKTFIEKRVPEFKIFDELYILGDHFPEEVDSMFEAYWRGRWEPMGYVKEYGGGKVFYTALGHGPEAFRHPEFQRIVIRGIEYVSGAKEGKEVRCGVIGYGGAFNMGKAHSDMMNQTPGLVTVAACDVDPERMEAAKKEQPGIATFTDPADMVKMKDLDLVVIITPHDNHAELSIMASKARKHVVVEKPMCLTVKEATAMIQAAKRSKKMLSVFHNRRWDGDYLAIREAVDKGLIGDVFQVETTMGGYNFHGTWWRGHKPISGGAFYDWAAHLIDWTLGFVPSKMVEITGFFYDNLVWHNATNEDHCRAIVRFENGAVAEIEVSHASRAPKPRFRILGTKGGIIDRWDGKFQMNTEVNGVLLNSEVQYRQGEHFKYYSNIADHLLLDEPLAVTGESARRVIAVIETAEKSSKQGKALSVPYE